jgi:hypothetical protein
VRVDADVPQPLQAAIEDALKRDPDERIDTARALVERLEATFP